MLLTPVRMMLQPRFWWALANSRDVFWSVLRQEKALSCRALPTVAGLPLPSRNKILEKKSVVLLGALAVTLLDSKRFFKPGGR